MNNSTDNFDSQMMRRCLEIASKALGYTAPNPVVGAVIVKNGEIIGEGFHPGAGNPHAEVFALREAGEKSQGATIYVNLEPCNHYGRTPPCTEALIAARVKKVVVGMIDPDSRVCGTGVERLRQAGIEVFVGVEEAACRKLNEGFIHRVIHKLPFGILKYAMTLDGKIATTVGHSAWISNKSSRYRVHQLRATCDGIIVGGNTLRQDNPLLTSHGVSQHNPLRVVMSRSFDLPCNCQLWDTQETPTTVFTLPYQNTPLKEHLLSQGVEVMELDDLTPLTVMQCLYDKGLMTVLWECGGNLAANAIAHGLIQKVMVFIAPKIIGGDKGYSPVGDLGLLKMTEAIAIKNLTWETIDHDLLIEGYL